MALRELRFVGPTWMPSYGQSATTVRLGSKWSTLKAGEYVKVMCCNKFHDGDCDCDLCEDYGYAVAEEVWAGQLGAIPARIIQEEHEPLCRMYYGLHNVLQEIYAPKPVDDFSQVVAIRFRRVSDYEPEIEGTAGDDEGDA